MKKLFIALLFPLTVNSQQVDTVIFKFSNGDIKYLVARGDAAVSTDSIWVSHNGVRSLISPFDLPINTVTQTALDGKQASGNYLLNTSTVGISTCPTASGTQTITHNLGRTPTVIEIYGVGRFTSNAAATPTPFSSGTWTSVSGNTCIYQTSAGTVTQDGLSSAVFSVFIATSSGNTISGVVQNVGGVSFQIAWTEIGTAAALPFRWKVY